MRGRRPPLVILIVHWSAAHLMFNFVSVLKKNPNHDNVAWAVHSEHADKWVWQRFWDALDFFWKLAMRLILKGGWTNINWEERINRLHLMVHAAAHCQQFINKRNVRYQPYGPWTHFPKSVFKNGTVTEDTSSSSSSDSSSDSSECEPDPQSTDCSSDPTVASLV